MLNNNFIQIFILSVVCHTLEKSFNDFLRSFKILEQILKVLLSVI